MPASDDFRKRLEARLWEDLERGAAIPRQPRRSFRPLRCVACGTLSWNAERGWRAYEPVFGEVAIYCPDCHAAELGDE